MPSIYKRSVQALQQYQYTIGIALSLFTIMFILSSLALPIFADDLWHSLVTEHWKAVYTSYMTWNPRIGELALLAGIASWSSIVFDIANSLVFTLFIFTYFFLVFGRIPATTLSGIQQDSVRVALITAFSFSIFYLGPSFLWRAGSLNFGWAITLLMLYSVPYKIYWNNWVNKMSRKTTSSKKVFLAIFMLLIGFIAGMSSEQVCAVLLCLHIFGITYLLYKKESIPLWYYTGFISLSLGFMALYFSPGIHMRGQGEETYRTLTQILDMPLNELVDRIFYTIKTGYHTNRASIKAFIVLCALTGISFLFSKHTITHKKYLRTIFIWIVAVALLWLFAVLITIQMPTVRYRAGLFTALLLTSSMLYMCEYLSMIFNRKVYTIIVVVFFISTTLGQIINWSFYRAECDIIIAQIEQSKAQGVKDVVITVMAKKRIFTNLYSFPVPNSTAGVNPLLAHHYGLNSIRLQEPPFSVQK